MSEIELFEIIKNQLLQKEQLGDFKEWKHYNFERLHENILRDTGFNISVLTLKRVLGRYAKDYKFNPQIATKDALATYLGYSGWDDFRRRNSPASTFVIPTLGNKKANKPKKKIWMFGFVLLGIAAIGIAIFFFSEKEVPSKVSFELSTLEGNTPQEVTIKYAIDPAIKDSFFVDFNDAQTEVEKRIYLPQDKQSYTHSYIWTGYYPIDIYQNKTLIDQQKVHIKTDNWLRYFMYRPYNRAFYDVIQDPTPYIPDGTLQTKKETIENYGLKASQFYWTEYRYFNKFNISGDDMKFETTVKNSFETGGIEFYDVIVRIICEHDSLRINFIHPGCTRWAKIQVSEKKIDGSEINLQEFGQSFENWRKIKVITKDNKCAIWLDDKLIQQYGYKNKLGEIKGVLYTFKGCGSVDDVEISNNNATEIYKEDFN